MVFLHFLLKLIAFQSTTGRNLLAPRVPNCSSDLASLLPEVKQVWILQLKMSAFVSAPFHGWSAMRPDGRQRKQPRCWRRRHSFNASVTCPRASMAVSITQAVGSSILVADDIYGRLAVGGIGIAVGSVLAVVVLGFIVRNNRENVCLGDTQGFRHPLITIILRPLLFS
jgi:hypothetical protein